MYKKMTTVTVIQTDNFSERIGTVSGVKVNVSLTNEQVSGTF